MAGKSEPISETPVSFTTLGHIFDPTRVSDDPKGSRAHLSRFMAGEKKENDTFYGRQKMDRKKATTHFSVSHSLVFFKNIFIPKVFERECARHAFSLQF